LEYRDRLLTVEVFSNMFQGPELVRAESSPHGDALGPVAVERTTLVDSARHGLHARTFSSVDDIAPWRAAWAELADVCARPACQPEWMIAWWRHARPDRSVLRLVMVFEQDRLVGVGPFFLDRGRRGPIRARLLAAPVSYRTEPLAVPGRETQVASVIATALAHSAPRPPLVKLEAVPSTSPWPLSLSRGWPCRRGAWLFRERSEPAPELLLAVPGFPEWFTGKSPNFRQQMRRARRQLERAGAHIRMVQDPASIARAVGDLCRLHHARWEWRGGPGVPLYGRVQAMLQAAAADLLPRGGLRIAEVAVDGRSISSHLFIAAGGEVSYWLGGFDAGWARQHPSMVALLAAIQHAWSLGDRRFDLNGGAQPYKYRLASREDHLSWWTIVPRGATYPINRLRFLPTQLYRSASRRLPERVKDPVWQLVKRASRRLRGGA
jgi:CelD/BcsL family acetyltransferase involved in cellulose biosynthesis